MGVPEARMERTEHGLVPKGDGWYVLNARDAVWKRNELGAFANFEGDVPFRDLGINVTVVEPGQPTTMYHHEPVEEDFLVVAGECIAIVEGQERRLRQWDFVHCPPGTAHAFVGAGDGPCVLVAVGSRAVEGGAYTVDEAALRHGAGVERETSDPREAYARFSPNVPGPAPDLP